MLVNEFLSVIKDLDRKSTVIFEKFGDAVKVTIFNDNLETVKYCNITMDCEAVSFFQHEIGAGLRKLDKKQAFEITQDGVRQGGISLSIGALVQDKVENLHAENWLDKPQSFDNAYNYVGLGDALESVAHSMGIIDVRYYLNGVFLDINQGFACATDGHRMTLCEIEKLEGKEGFIIPNAHIKPLTASGASTLLFNKDIFQYKDLKKDAITRGIPIDGKFPDYQRVRCHTDNSEFKEFDYKELLQHAINISKLKLKYPALKVKDGKLTGGPMSGDTSAYAVDFESPFDFVVSSCYLMDALKSYKDKDVMMHATGKLLCLRNSDLGEPMLENTLMFLGYL